MLWHVPAVSAQELTCCTSSAWQIRPLLPGRGRSALLITSQSEIASPVGSRRWQLSPFTDEEASDLLSQIVGGARVAAEPAAAAELARACGGLPLAIRIVGMRLAARPSWRLSALAARLAQGHGRLGQLVFGDLCVAATFARSYRRLTAAEQRAFAETGLFGQAGFTESQLAEVGDTDAIEVAACLADASLVAVTGPDRDGNLHYRLHCLLLEYAGELLGARSDHEPARAALTG